MKKGKKIAIILGIIVIAIVAVIAIILVKDFRQEETLTYELNSLFDLINLPLKNDEIDAKLNQTVTTGSYYDVETSVKTYMADVISSLKKLDSLLDEEKLSDVLSTSNMKKDGPNFTNTKKYLKESKETLNEVSSELLNYFTEEQAMKYIEDKHLDNYYIELYKKYVIESNSANMEQDRKELIDSLEQMKALLNKQQEIIDFLVKNKNNWTIEDDSLVCYSQSVLDQYNQLVSELENL